jgi:hypothetical protein
MTHINKHTIIDHQDLGLEMLPMALKILLGTKCWIKFRFLLDFDTLETNILKF